LEIESKITKIKDTNNQITSKQSELEKLNKEINEFDKQEFVLTEKLASNKEMADFYTKQTELYKQKNILEADIRKL
jgi:hypothetical protein